VQLTGSARGSILIRFGHRAKIDQKLVQADLQHPRDDIRVPGFPDHLARSNLRDLDLPRRPRHDLKGYSPAVITAVELIGLIGRTNQTSLDQARSDAATVRTNSWFTALRCDFGLPTLVAR
jgi:hypothetical protein